MCFGSRGGSSFEGQDLDIARITCTSMKNKFRGSTEVRSRVVECWPESDEIETNIDLSGINSWNKKKRRKEGE